MWIKSNFKIKVTCLRLKLLLCEWMSDHTGALGMSVRKKIVCTYICMKSPVSLTLNSPNNLSLKILRFSTKLRAVHTAQLLICIIQHVQKKTWKAVARAKQNQKSLFHRIIGNKLVLRRELCSRFNPKLFHFASLLGQKNGHWSWRGVTNLMHTWTLIPLILFSWRSQESYFPSKR